MENVIRHTKIFIIAANILGISLAGCSADGAVAPPKQDPILVAGVSAAGTLASVGNGAVSPAGRAALGTAPSSGTGGTVFIPPPSTPVPVAGRAAPIVPAPPAPIPAAGRAAPTPAAGTAAPPAAGSSAPAPAMSEGCGKTMFPPSARNMMDVMGTQREYIVKLPTNYDPNKPYKLVFAWHYLGGNAQGIATGFGGGYYGLESMSGGSTIFVAPEGIDAAWPNTGGRDINFAKAMVTWMRSNYCIDNKRIFSVGFSYGAIMSNTVGCQMGDVFRAIAPMSGSGPLGTGCKGPVAAWLAHGTADTTVAFSGGQRSRDHWIMANGCTTQTMPTDPSPCVAYQGCMSGYPVVWCENPGAGHMQPAYGGAAIWKFFSQF
jgi:polyhydroxybutyrate depolymerase